jgi:hypothetical protein
MLILVARFRISTFVLASNHREHETEVMPHDLRQHQRTRRTHWRTPRLGAFPGIQPARARTYHSDVFTFPPDGDWDATCAEIDTIASGHGVTGHKALGGHYIAAKSFGSIQYRAVAIPHSNPVDSEQSR